MTPTQLLIIAPAIADDPSVVRPWPGWQIWGGAALLLIVCACVAWIGSAWWIEWVEGITI